MQDVIAIDFDGCLCSDNYPDIGEPNWDVINEANKRRKEGAALILWTCRDGKLLANALIACNQWGLIFDAVNDNLECQKRQYGRNTRKVGATEYWDDRAVTKKYAIVSAAKSP